MVENEKDTHKESAVPQKVFVSFMVREMALSQKDRFQKFCDQKGLNYAPAITLLLEHYESFWKEKETDVKKL